MPLAATGGQVRFLNGELFMAFPQVKSDSEAPLRAPAYLSQTPGYGIRSDYHLIKIITLTFLRVAPYHQRIPDEEITMAEQRIAIFDTTLRDGEQSPGCSMNLEEKVRVARQLKLVFQVTAFDLIRSSLDQNQ